METAIWTEKFRPKTFSEVKEPKPKLYNNHPKQSFLGSFIVMENKSGIIVRHGKMPVKLLEYRGGFHTIFAGQQ